MSERGNYKANFSPTVNCLRVIEKLNIIFKSTHVARIGEYVLAFKH